MSSSDGSADACPLDHKAREAWLKQARADSGGDAITAATPHTPSVPSQSQAQAQPAPAKPSSSSWTSTIRSYLPTSSSSTTPSHETSQSPDAFTSKPRSSGLDTNRIVSSIPRTGPAAAAEGCPVPHDDASSPPGAAAAAAAASQAHASASHGRPANNEADTGADPKTGNWVYPSEKMFFEAMKRKGHDSVQTADMKTVVPIHNAVNERAWKEIKEWERPYTEGTACAGPRLHSFSGLSDRMTPRARFNTILGYTAPFDRHDWVVDRCGVQVEYVIDFYAGRPGTRDPMGKPSFYLDVRPKLNSWEGWRMRALRGLGLL